MGKQDRVDQGREEHPIVRWQQRWQPDPLQPGAKPIAGAQPMSRRQKVVLAPFALFAIGLCALCFITSFFTEYSIDPRDTDVYYVNDGDVTVVVRECLSDCSTLGRSYKLKPGDLDGYSLRRRHKMPVAIRVEDIEGLILGCVTEGGKPGKPSYYFLISRMQDCSLITPSPTA